MRTICLIFLAVVGLVGGKSFEQAGKQNGESYRRVKKELKDEQSDFQAHYPKSPVWLGPSKQQIYNPVQVAQDEVSSTWTPWVGDYAPSLLPHQSQVRPIPYPGELPISLYPTHVELYEEQYLVPAIENADLSNVQHDRSQVFQSFPNWPWVSKLWQHSKPIHYRHQHYPAPHVYHQGNGGFNINSHPDFLFQKNFIKRESIKGAPSDHVEQILNMTPFDINNMYPKDAIEAIDSVCNADSLPGISKQAPSISEIQVDLLNHFKNRRISLDQIESLLEDPEYDSKENLTIYITGWAIDSPLNGDNIAFAYSCRHGSNLMLIDIGQSIYNLRDWLSLDVHVVGQMLANVLAKNLSPIHGNNIHLIGHGLGADIAGHVGRHYQEMTGQQIARITGLDPARYCISRQEQQPGLNKDDAEFVDSIHTNPNVFGEAKVVGDIDFYPNGINNVIQPHTRNLMSSHLAAIDYYLESVLPGLENSYVAKPGFIPSEMDDSSSIEIPMGYLTPKTADKVEYTLVTGIQRPYGMNVDPSYKVKCSIYPKYAKEVAALMKN